MSNDLAQTISNNVSFLAVCILVIVVVFAIAVVFDNAAKKKNNQPSEKTLTTRMVVIIGAFSAVATILFCLDFPVFFAPGFYKLDFSELPALITGFAFGPVAGVLVELIKVIVKIFIKGTSTAFVGELANFVIGCSFIMPASIIYGFRKTKKMAIISCVVGTILVTIFGSLFNAVYLLPAFATLYGMPIESLIAAGTAVNKRITDITSFVILAVAPLNIVKGTIVSVITVLVYKKLSVILKHGSNSAQG